MTFRLGAWIDDHSTCRHNLALSGMRGSVRAVPFPRPRGDPDELRDRLARLSGVGPERLFLTHGATEANALVAAFVGARSARRAAVCRVRFPEYPPLFDLPRALGFRLDTGRRPARLAVVSQPRNPEGDLWSVDRLLAWASGADHLLVDETFREFGPGRSVASLARRRVWTTGTFTKFYGGDDVRVGYVIAPSEERDDFHQFHGVAADEVAPGSIASALALLDDRARLVREVRSIVGRNRRALRRWLPEAAVPIGPVYFDRAIREPSETLAGRCLAASVLICPGGFFGDARGARICLTRRSFPVDLDAYLVVRDGGGRPGRSTRGGSTTGARPGRAGSAPGPDARA